LIKEDSSLRSPDLMLNEHIASQYTNFRDYLASELSRRCEKNSKYSLRSFAKTLHIDPASLHRILTGKRAISRQMLERLCARLQLGPKEVAHFQKDILGKPALPEFNFEPTTIDNFEVISEWQHLAILELVTLKDFKPNEKWIAERLGLSLHVARASVERLFKVGLLEIDGKGWKLSHNHNSFAKDGYSTVARQQLQKSYLEKAKECIDLLDMDQRDNSGVTFAIDTDHFDELIQKISAFRKEIAALSSKRSKNANEVYQLTIALFPLTKLKKINKKNTSKENRQ